MSFSVPDAGIYLDNAAACPCDRETLAAFNECAAAFPANQEAGGFHAANAASAMSEAAENLVNSLCGPGADASIVWSNTGTDALAAAVACAAESGTGTLAASNAEHPALETALLRASESGGAPLEFCPLDRSGAIDLSRLEGILRKNKVGLLALHHVQPETGRIQDLAAVREILDRLSPETVFLADTMQTACKYHIPWREARLDLAVLSGQKFGCPGGAALVLRKKFEKTAKRLRSEKHLFGRCVPAAALTLARRACSLAARMEENSKRASTLKKTFLNALGSNGFGFKQAVGEKESSGYIASIVTAPMQGAILMRMLSSMRISVSAGSACESETPAGSRALHAMGFTRRETYSLLRVSTWLENTPEEMRLLADSLAECAEKY